MGDKKIPDFETKHFLVPGEQIKRWDKNKKLLPIGIGRRKYIAPEDLVVILKAPFYYNPEEETWGYILGKSILVYGEEWVGKKIAHLPFCEELFKIHEHLKQYGWFIPGDWATTVYGIVDDRAKKLGIERYQINDAAKSDILQKEYGLGLSGFVKEGVLRDVGKSGEFWSGVEETFASSAWLCHVLESDCGHYLYLDSYGVGYRNGRRHCGDALSVRCVAR